MCGISFVLTTNGETNLDEIISSLLSSRGPDVTRLKHVNLDEQLLCIFQGSVLWMQGKAPQEQPLSNENGDIFLWNGDRFNVENSEESDTLSIFKNLKNKTEEEIVFMLSTIEGPWSFIYYSHSQKKLYFGRDMFGRHSLLWTPPLKNNFSHFILSSAAKRQDALQEVPAVGIYVAEVESLLSDSMKVSLYPFSHVSDEQLLVSELKFVKLLNSRLKTNIRTSLCKDLPCVDTIEQLKKFSASFDEDNLFILREYLSNEIKLFEEVFKKSIKKRINACPPKCKMCTYSTAVCSHTKYAVLFSGGLDSALIALYLSKCLPLEEPIDLLNVSFECRRSMNNTWKKIRSEKAIFDFNSPDRLSGLACLKELQNVEEKRKWNFIEINVSAEELKTARKEIISDLVSPQCSVLDDSIGCALFFCGKGAGYLGANPYTSPARVVFSGLGADEQLGGYSRHRVRFNELGWKGLITEIDLEMSRIHQRNCGRDDRVLSHHGRSARFPYLDEDVVSCLNSLCVWKKTNLYMPRGIGEKLLLRVIAAHNGLATPATLPKRAIQFGSRIAKLENSKEKGSDICHRFQDIKLRQ